MTVFESPEEIDERLQILEGKILYQDRTIDDLNSVLIRQQDQIDALVTEVKRLRAIADVQAESVDAGEEPPPPHY